MKDTPVAERPLPWVPAHPLVGVLSMRQHVGLQLGEVALLVAALADPHVQQMGVDGRVVGLQQPSLDGLSFRETHTRTAGVELGCVEMLERGV